MPVCRFILVLLLLPVCHQIAADSVRPAWMDQGPYVEEKSFAVALPVTWSANKVFVEVMLGGSPRRFLFDTGSPSMLSRALAGELQLKVIDSRQGRDAHGAVVDTDIVQADLGLGGITLHKVPVFVADFPHTAQCLFDGVLGSEVLPLCAWQLDMPDGMLRCHTDINQLEHIKGAQRQPLHTYGYPHTPFVDIRLARQAVSKAMLDTGSPDYMTISPPDFEGARRNQGVAGTTRGQGALGGSLGGLAAKRDQVQVELKSLQIGDMPLGTISAPLREIPPSLLGAALLQHFVVTLDSRNSQVYFDQYNGGPYHRAAYGFGLDFENEVSVSLVWDQSPASEAGLKVGDKVMSINGQPVSGSCTDIRRTMQAMSEGDSIQLEWQGGSKAKTLTRQH